MTIGVGKAQAFISFAAWKEGDVAPSKQEIEIVPPLPGPKLAAVSSRLQRSLIHPNKSAVLYGLRFSPDGKRLVAGDYPGGVVQVWEVAAGKQLAKIDTGPVRRAIDFFEISPDGRTLYVPRIRLNATRDMYGRMIRWVAEGDVRAWDLGTGELRATYRSSPPWGVSRILLSPDGCTFAAFGSISSSNQSVAGLWNIKEKKLSPLPAGDPGSAVFTPDGKTLVMQIDDKATQTAKLAVFDVPTAKKRRSISFDERDLGAVALACSPDGKILTGLISARTGMRILLWDLTSGRKIGSLEAEKRNALDSMAYSPDGGRLAVANRGSGEAGKLFLFDLRSKEPRKTILLAGKETAEAVLRPVFSPDGKWIAVATQVVPDRGRVREPGETDSCQPRIHLIEVASGEIRETIVAPVGVTASLCFSPDGKSLATGSNGRILLWDLAKPSIGSPSPHK